MKPAHRNKGLVWSIGMGLLVLVGIIAALLVIGFLSDQGRPIRWEVPAGYRGWIIVLFENPACPSLRSDDRYEQVVPIDSNGCGCTSSAVPRGWRHHRYEYVEPAGTRTRIPESGWGGGGEIWAGYGASGQAGFPFPFQGYFVGTEAELTSWGWVTPDGGARSAQKERECGAAPRA